MTVLDDILAQKRDEVTVLRQPQTRDLLRRTALDAPPKRVAVTVQSTPANQVNLRARAVTLRTVLADR